MPNQYVYDDSTQAVAGDDMTFANQINSSTAFSFTSAAGSAGTLIGVKLDIGDATPSDGGSVSVSLYSDSPHGPATLLASLGTVADSSLSSTDSYIDFLPIGSTSLAAGTVYWIEMTDNNSGAYIGYEAGDAGTGVSTGSYEDSGDTPVTNASGFADLAQVTENVAASDQPPVVTTSSGETAFVAGATIAVDGGVTVTDADNSTLASATVSITGNFQAGEDVLAFDNNNASAFGNIMGVYNSASGVETLTSANNTATVAQFQAALEAVTYTDIATTPDTLTRTISFTANDGTETGDTATKELTVADSAQSRLVYDNTAQPLQGDETDFERGGSTAFSFTSATSSAGMLADIKLDLGDATPSDGGTVGVFLYSNSNSTNAPGAEIASLGTVADSSLGATPSYVDIPVSSTIDLVAGTRYWVELTDSASSGAYSGYEFGATGTGVSGEYFDAPLGTINSNSSGAYLAQVTEVTCFCPGTLILTDRGEVAIERLAIGDRVVTASGEKRPVSWTGHRSLDCRRFADPGSVWPVRVCAGAFGENRPSRDLWLSPAHNIAAEGVLMPIRALLNGRTIVQVERPRVEYWHVELDAHDVILAEGLPAESYLDTGNRMGFLEGGAFIEAHPDFRPKDWTETCLPLVFDGDEVTRTKAMLLARVAALGHATTYEADLHILADGRRVEPIRLGAMRFAFALPADCADIRLKSRTFVPAHVRAEWTDARSLGVCVGRLEIDGEAVPLERAAQLGEGWDGVEPGHVWTRGKATLPPGTRLALLDLALNGEYWAEPSRNVVPLFG